MCPSEHAEAVSSFSRCRGNSWTSGEAVLSPLLDLKPGIKAWPKPGNARITSPAPAPRGKDSTFAGVCWNKPRTCSEEHKITALPAAHSFPFCVKCLEILPCPDKKPHFVWEQALTSIPCSTPKLLQLRANKSHFSGSHPIKSNRDLDPEPPL